MDPQKALYFRNEFREARAVALKDAEGYQQILFVLERFGAFMRKKVTNLGDYEKCISLLVNKHHPFQGKPPKDYHIEFDSLYEIVRQGRNDALHQGAVARNLTSRSVELSLMLEDALMSASKSKKVGDYKVGDYMVRNPVRAYAWQLISFVRQMMLENSFSYIPVYMEKKDAEEKAWYIIADYHIAMYLQSATNSDCRGKLLAKSIEDAIGSNKMAIEKALTASLDETIEKVLERTEEKSTAGKPILVVKKRDNCEELLGIATAFDLM